MLNLRSLDDANRTHSTSDNDHFSRFSVSNFQVPPAFIGNFGELLDVSFREGPGDAYGNDSGLTGSYELPDTPKTFPESDAEGTKVCHLCTQS